MPAKVAYAADGSATEALQSLHQHGNTLLIKGRPLAPLPREVLPCFAYSIIDLSDERREAGRAAFERIVKGVADTHGCTAEVIDVSRSRCISRRSPSRSQRETTQIPPVSAPHRASNAPPMPACTSATTVRRSTPRTRADRAWWSRRMS